MPVTRPLLSCSPFLSFQSAFRASGQSCAQCPWFLHNLHFVQPEKSCSPLAHSCAVCAACAACAASRAALLCTTASCISLFLRRLRCSRCLSFSASRCACLCVLLRLSCRRTVEVGVEFQCIQLSHWVDGCFGGADLTVFSCGKHKHTVD